MFGGGNVPFEDGAVAECASVLASVAGMVLWFEVCKTVAAAAVALKTMGEASLILPVASRAW